MKSLIWASCKVVGLGSLLGLWPMVLTAGGCASAPVEAPKAEPAPRVVKKRSFTRRKGTLERKPVEDAIKGAVGRFSVCYQSRLVRTPDTPVRLTVGFSINEEGRAIKLSVVEAAGSDQAMNHCILDIMAEVEFPSPVGGHVDVSYPFEFKP